jgi:hypothetical protein
MAGIRDALAALQAKVEGIVPEVHPEIPFLKVDDGRDSRRAPLPSCERRFSWRFRTLDPRDDGVVAADVADLATTVHLEVAYPAGGLDRGEDLDLELASDAEQLQLVLDREAAWPGAANIARVQVSTEREDLEDRVLLIHRLVVFYRREGA